jgi:hypothetical protein
MAPLIENPMFARYFARCGVGRETQGNAELHAEVLAGLAGRVIELA